jgi:hypothetical protein
MVAVFQSLAVLLGTSKLAHPMKRQPFLGLATSVAIAAGCSPSAGSGAEKHDASDLDAGPPIEELPPIDVAAPTKLVVDLSTSEEILLCDWNAREFGGYGMSIPCLDDSGNPGLAAPASIEDCVSTFQFGRWGSNCPLTVQDFMTCVAWQVDNVCNVYNLPLPPECKTQGGPQCEGAIYSDAQAASTFDATEAGSGDATLVVDATEQSGKGDGGTGGEPGSDGADGSPD